MKINGKRVNFYTNEQRRRWRISYHTKNPWAKTKQSIVIRCTRPNQYHCQKGIKDLISVSELKELWFRDKAYEMKRPSIDRIDSKGHYIFDNCRYMELSENIRRAGLERWKKYREVK